MDPDAEQYRVVSKWTMALWLAATFLILAAVAWYGHGWVQEYAADMDAQIDADPEEAAQALSRHLRYVAVGLTTFLCLTSLYLVSHGLRAFRTQRMPPPGSWVIEGRQIRVGRRARFAGGALVFLAGCLAVAAVALGFILWSMADRLLAAAAGA